MIPPVVAIVAGMAASFLMFASFRGARALGIAYVSGILLLPPSASLNLPGLPAIDKERAIWLGAAAGTLVFHPGCLRRFRFHRADLVLLAFVALVGASSIVNSLGTWDALSAGSGVMLSTMLPCMLARVHFSSSRDVVDFTRTLVVGGLLFVPLAVWEFRMSPQLCNTVYGYFPHEWLQQVRWGFFRPILFLGHGLATAALFGGCLLFGIVLTRYGLLKRWSMGWPWAPVMLLGLGLGVTMSVGPWLSAVAGWFLYRLSDRRRWLPVAAGSVGVFWILSVFMYGDNWSWLTRPFEAIGATSRAASLQYRLDAMTEHADKIRERPWFGYGRWGRGGLRTKATDSEALVYMLDYGILATSAWYAWLLWIAAASSRASRKAETRVERDVLLMCACLIGFKVTLRMVGAGSFFLPDALIAGAVTCMYATQRVRRRQQQVVYA